MTVQNEIRKGYNMVVRDDEEENVALVAKGKKGKPKKGASSNNGSKGKGKQKNKEGKEKDLSKVGHVRRWGIMLQLQQR